jgi:tetratricopeptide (TPR) repeat protein
MNKEQHNFHEEEEIVEAIQRYEEMLKTGEMYYFDVFQIEHIIDSYIEEGKLYPSLKVVELGLEQHPASMNILIKKAGILFNLGETASALALIDNLLLIEDTNPELYLLKGSSHLTLGDKLNARISFEKSLKYSYENREDIYYNIGYSYEQAGHFKKALSYFLRVFELNEKNEIVLYEIAYCYEKIGENYKSIEFYNKYLDIDPFSNTAWFNLGIVYNKIEKHRKAADAYEYSLVINDDFPSAWYNLGNTYMLRRKFDKAIDAFKEFLKYDDASDEICCVIGDCYIQLRNQDKAFEFYQKAITFNKQNDRAWFGSGLIMKLKNDYHAAYNYLRKAVSIDDKNSEYWFFVAKICSKLNLFVETADAYEKVCELSPGKLTAWFKYSELLHHKGMVIRAISVLETGLIYHPLNALFHYRLSAYYLESMNEKNAVKHLKKALTVDSSRYNYLFELYPEAQFNATVVKLITKYSSPTTNS